MGFFKKLFANNTQHTQELASSSTDSATASAFGAPVLDAKERALVSAIALSIAAGDRPDSEFIIKKIQKKHTTVKENISC